MNRIILYVGMVYNFFCAEITANLIADSHKLGTFGKYLLIFSLMISIWYIILILMKNADKCNQQFRKTANFNATKVRENEISKIALSIAYNNFFK